MLLEPFFYFYASPRSLRPSARPVHPSRRSRSAPAARRSIIVNALGSSIAPVFNAFILVILVCLVYAVLGVQVRAGRDGAAVGGMGAALVSIATATLAMRGRRVAGAGVGDGDSDCVNGKK